MTVASLSTPTPANAWCVGFSGINIGTSNAPGGGCQSTFGNFALGLGTNALASSNGLFTGAIAFGDAIADVTGLFSAAWAGGDGSQSFADGIANWAFAQGAGVFAYAGAGLGDIANFAFNVGNATDGTTSTVAAVGGVVNLAANFGGNSDAGGGEGPVDMDIFAGDGFGNFAINLLGNRNQVAAGSGWLNTAIAVGTPFFYPNGSNSTVNAGLGSLNFAFNVQPPFITPTACPPCGNDVFAGNGSFGLAGSIGQVGAVVEQVGPGFNINDAVQLPPSMTAVIEARQAQRSLAGVSTASDSDDSTEVTVPDAATLKSSSGGAKEAKASQKASSAAAKEAKASSAAAKEAKSSLKPSKKLSDAVSKIKAKRAAKAASADSGGNAGE